MQHRVPQSNKICRQSSFLFHYTWVPGSCRLAKHNRKESREKVAMAAQFKHPELSDREMGKKNRQDE